MSKVGRNDPCPCGSGNKYKRCCLAKDEEVERQAIAAAAAARQTHDHAIGADQNGGPYTEDDDDLEELTMASNSVIDLVRADRLDEAEKVAYGLLERFPEVHDGYDRLAMVHEKRGEPEKAIECYRKVIDFVRAHPDTYDPAFEASYQEIIDRLARPAPSDEPSPAPSPNPDTPGHDF